MTRWTISAFLLGLAGCLALTPSSEAVRTESARLPTVRIVEVRDAPEHREVVAHGITTAVHRGDLSFTVGGRLARRAVDIGDHVHAGDVLAVLDARGYDHAKAAALGQVEQLEAQLGQLRADQARLDRLEAGRMVSDVELQRIGSQVDAAQSALDAARAQSAEAGRQRGEAVMVAPFDGVVTAVFRQPGETLSPGAPLLSLAGDGASEVRLQVPESIWAALHVGDPATVELPGIGRRAPATLSSVAGASGPDGLFPIVVALDDHEVAGLTARVRLGVPLGAEAMVPMSAVVDPTGTTASVYKVVEGHVERVDVDVLALLGDEAAVRGALRADDAVVVAGHARLLAGDEVEVLP